MGSGHDGDIYFQRRPVPCLPLPPCVQHWACLIHGWSNLILTHTAHCCGWSVTVSGNLAQRRRKNMVRYRVITKLLYMSECIIFMIYSMRWHVWRFLEFVKQIPLGECSICSRSTLWRRFARKSEVRWSCESEDRQKLKHPVWGQSSLTIGRVIVVLYDRHCSCCIHYHWGELYARCMFCCFLGTQCHLLQKNMT